jgi:hypothetical protein
MLLFSSLPLLEFIFRGPRFRCASSTRRFVVQTRTFESGQRTCDAVTSQRPRKATVSVCVAASTYYSINTDVSKSQVLVVVIVLELLVILRRESITGCVY